MKKLLSFGKSLGKEIQEDQATGLAAEQAYYYMLSLFPMLILLISIVPYLSIKPEEAIDVLQSVMPGETAAIFKDNVAQFVSQPNGGLLTVGILGTIWSASNGMNAFIRAMNQAYDVKEQRSFIKVRGLSILLTIGLIVTIVVSLLLPVFGGVLLNGISEWFSLPSGTTVVLNILRWIIGVGIMVLVLSVLYRLAPNKTFPFAHVWPGALAATLLWQLTSLGFSFYVSNFGNYSATYGSLGGVIVLMLWLFLTGLILVIGGEINAIYHRNKTAAPPKDTSQAM
ncbi:membrane protein [Priestia megaterium]|jgi:membrane protein|uniref:YihY/virulence factor BrkB family protein n=1 Tax=Priestia megaterium TaxID=1404 RepID=UPI00046ECDF5|nr:YihY/virulence factor BrkB family protein [Priestia megaterium]TCN10115.1 membrane protein [Bacillus sp. BK006]MCM3018457.1 YihY/virulence factor BrkB family protein [Priestia megaterium]MCM3184737.1 YihY/virulence factor BrkB family protein [Priestia megaterium]MCM3195346.1 YihY/virulence factor BrkB family protein [Priestia megaterium]MED3917149.1 YihY/virulence factor BrkB family protein [Priestia megaterium]